MPTLKLELHIGKVDFGGIKKDVNLAMVPEAKIGDYVLVHVGAALSVINEKEAKETFNILKQMGEVEEFYNLQKDE